MFSSRNGIETENRDRLERLHREICGPFDAAQAAIVWATELPRTRRLLAHLATRGWLARVRRGLYVTVPLGATTPAEWRADPWAVAARSFNPCYVSGWSACEHWELTEQIFRDVAVVTSAPVRQNQVVIQGTHYHLMHRPAARIFGTKSVWRDHVQIRISDPTRTVVDILDVPRLGGGIRHVADVLNVYFGGAHRNDRLLVEYAKKLGNRTVFKRLGFLLEALEIDASDLIAKCFAMRSSGLTSLDPTMNRRGRLSKRWNLRVNANIRREELR